MSIDKDSLKAGAELLEVVVDTFITSDGLAKDIPFVGTIFSLADACNTFRNKRFAKRVSAFLTNFSPEDFEKFKKAIADKSNEDLGEEILSVIENLERDVQTNMVARATKVHISLLENGHAPSSIKYILDYSIHIIKHLDSHLLASLHAIYGGKSSIRISTADQVLYSLGLVKENHNFVLSKEGHAFHRYLPNDEGRSFYKNIVCGDEIAS